KSSPSFPGGLALRARPPATVRDASGVGLVGRLAFSETRMNLYDTIITGCATAISVLNALNARTVYWIVLPDAVTCAGPESWRCGRAAPGRRERKIVVGNGDGLANSMIISSMTTSAPPR